jgi:hypothetical protein
MSDIDDSPVGESVHREGRKAVVSSKTSPLLRGFPPFTWSGFPDPGDWFAPHSGSSAKHGKTLVK